MISLGKKKEWKHDIIHIRTLITQIWTPGPTSTTVLRASVWSK